MLGGRDRCKGACAARPAAVASDTYGGMAMGHLDGRVAFLTGAGRGIGAATARALAARGAAVVVADLDLGPAEETAAAIRAVDGKALALALDVTARDQMEAAVARTMAEFGRLDILVALAGVIRDNLLFKMTD